MNKFFCIFCILLFILKTENVYSNNLIYDVNNIEVKTKISNNLNNQKLIEKAFKKAFIIFVDKTLLRADALSLYKTKLEIIKNLVFTYQITENKNNNNIENISTYNIRFDPKKINNFLTERGISYADISNISITVLPILIENKDILMYEENFFYKNWIELKNLTTNKRDKLITYNLALENIEDLEYINKIKDKIDLIDIKKINSFNEYENFVLLIIYSAEGKLKAFLKTSIKNINIDRNIDLDFYSLNKKKSYEEAIINLKKEINQIWKEQNLIDVNTPSFLDFFLETKKLNDYLKLKLILDNIDVIENYSVLEMTNAHLKIRLKYRGKLNKIKNKLTEQKINIKIIDNIWKLKLNK